MGYTFAATVTGGSILSGLNIPDPGGLQPSSPHALAFFHDDSANWSGLYTGDIPGVGEPGGLVLERR